MAAWLIRVTAKRRKEIDKHLLVQAVLALGRQLWQQEEQAAHTARQRDGAQEQSS